MKLSEYFLKSVKGITSHHVAMAMSNIDRGSNWRGCSKQMMVESAFYDGSTKEHFGSHSALRSVEAIDKIALLAKKIQLESLAYSAQKRKEAKSRDESLCKQKKKEEQDSKKLAMFDAVVSAGTMAIQQLESIRGNLYANSLGLGETDCVIRDAGAVLVRAKEIK